MTHSLDTHDVKSMTSHSLANFDAHCLSDEKDLEYLILVVTTTINFHCSSSSTSLSKEFSLPSKVIS